MKTLEQLWKENGEKPGLRVTQVEWPKNWFCDIYFIDKSGRFITKDHGGGLLVCWTGTNDWELYTEPEELVDHWPAIISYQPTGDVAKRLFLTQNLYCEKDTSGIFCFVRLAKEYSPIKLPRKK